MSEDKRRIPKLRFPGFEGEWEERKLGEIGTVAMNKRIFKSQTTERGEIPFYKIGTFGGEPDAYISRALFEEYKMKWPYPKVGDILISASGSIGKTVEYAGKDEYFQDSNIVWLEHDEKVDNSFLKYFYMIVKWDGIEGTTIKRLYNANILNTKISFPSVAEQQKISGFLKQVDNLIIYHQYKIEHLKKIKTGLLQKMFPKAGEKVPEIRFPGFTGDWKRYKLGEVVGNTYGGGTPKTNVEEYWNGEIPWIQSSNVAEDEMFDIDISKKISEQGLAKSATKLVPENSIAVVTHVGVGKLVFMPFPYTTSQDFTSLSELKTDAQFTCYSLYKRLKNDLHVVQGSAIKGITKEDLLSKELIIPSMEEQRKIGEYFRNIDRLITLHQRKLEHLQQLKKGLLKQMLV